MRVAGWKHLAPVYFYTALVVCLIAITPRQNISGQKTLLLIIAGVFSWTLIEYALHRFIFHFTPRSEFGRKFVYAAHLSHHENPRAINRLFSGLLISLPIAIVYLFLAWVATGSLQATTYLFTGLTAGYSCYEWLHFRAHHSRPRLRFFRYLRKYHLLHHYQTPQQRFGVTSPLLDVIFGTFRPVRKRKRSSLVL